MNDWKKMSAKAIRTRVMSALDQNIRYDDQGLLGVPASRLDDKVFYRNADFLAEAPFLSTLMENPNHIGCHTLEQSEPFFAGTQAIERELINICASEILGGAPGQQDGYLASGGTEANIQAIWIYRNQYIAEFNAKPEEICILCSSDSHYSMDKAANLLCIDVHKVAVETDTRLPSAEAIQKSLTELKAKGKKYLILVANMMTTMFGSVDPLEQYLEPIKAADLKYRVHVDGAFGGFYYPFSNKNTELAFSNPEISSVTLDAHKMLQAPYGTGIFLARKGLMQYASTQSASYVEGQDNTLIGSRSGANAVAVWMILVINGPDGWRQKINELQQRTQLLCNQLDNIGISYYRNPGSNIVTIRQNHISADIAKTYGLVPDDHANPDWYKVVVMEHVTQEKLQKLVNALGG